MWSRPSTRTAAAPAAMDTVLQPEVEMICCLRSPQSAPAGPAERMIISNADPYVREFKHHFEGAWHR